MLHRWYIVLLSPVLLAALACAAHAESGFALIIDRGEPCGEACVEGCTVGGGEACDIGCGEACDVGCEVGCEPSCDNGCDPSLWRPCTPIWRVQADALFLTRSNPRTETLLVDQAGTAIFNAQNVHFPTQIGWAIDLTRRLNDDWEVEGKYFNLGGQSARTSPFVGINGAGVLYNHNTADAIGIFNVDTFSTVSYASDLQSIEINGRRRLSDDITFLMGARYIGLNDGGILVIQQALGGLVDARQQIDATNDMIGGQLGIEAVGWRRGRLSIDSYIKAGIYGNRASNRLAYDSNFFGVHASTGAKTANTAFLGEMGVTGRFEVGRGWFLHAGYQIIWLDAVAEAYQQPGVNLPPINAPATNVRTTGDVIYQGAFTGVEYRW